MKCPRCQFENQQGMKFCGECGERLQSVCPACKALNPPNHKFCGECGQRLSAAAPLGPEPSPVQLSSAPETYTPKHLAQRILSSREALEGERKRVTVLFADLKGSTELIQDLDPEETRLLLDRALHAMMDAVHAYEGTVNQIMGDGIMALFGAPVAHEDHAVRACYAALAMQQGIRRYAEETLRERGVPVRIRVGLNSGEVVVRTIANDLRMDYSAIGPTTHLAARMEQNAQDGTTLLTPETFRLTEGYVEARSMGRIPVKGVSEPMEVYQLIGTGPLRTRFQVSASRGLTRFVGREHELEVLSKAVERSATGEGQMVALVGEAGTGKSRLVWEVTQSSNTDGWLVLQTMSTSYAKTGPYAPVIELMRQYYGVEADDTADMVRGKVTHKLLSLDEALLTTLPASLALLDVPIDATASSAEADWLSMDPPQRRRRTLDAISSVLGMHAHCQPVLLVIEDMQSIDAESRAVVDRLVESVPHERMMLLITYRQEQHQPVPVRPVFTQLSIEALSPENADELLDELVGEGSKLAHVKQFLIERTKGNPFFLEELVRTMVETGVLEGERGAYKVAKPLHAVQVPASVQAVVSARIDRLASEDKRVLQAASVIGMELPHATLDAILEVSSNDLDSSLDRLERAHFLSRTQVFPEPEYAFKHGLTREVAYEGLLLQRRRALHSQIVDVIERLYPEHLVEKVDRLAHHALAGEVWDKAVRYSRQAAAKAALTAAYRAAIGSLEQALVALQHLPSMPDTQREAIDIRLELRSSLLPVGELQAIHDHMRIAEKLAEELGEQERLARIDSYLCQYFTMAQQPDSAVEIGERAVKLARDVGRLGLQISTSMILGEALYQLGHFGRCVQLQRRSIGLLKGELRYERFGMTGLPAAMSRGFLTLGLAELGNFGEAELVSAEGIQLAEEINHPYTQQMLYLNDGYFNMIRGDWPNAVGSLTRAIEVCTRLGFTVQLTTATARLGYAHVASGYPAIGLPLLEQAADQADSLGRHYDHAMILTLLSDGYRYAGRLDHAFAAAARAVELADRGKQQGKRAYALRMLGEAQAGVGDEALVQAEAYLVRALEVATQLGMRPLQAHIHLGLSRVYHRQNRLRHAQEQLAKAMWLYNALSMPFWLQEAELQRDVISASAPARTGSAEPQLPAELVRTR